MDPKQCETEAESVQRRLRKRMAALEAGWSSAEYKALQQCPELSLPALPDVWAGHSKIQWEKEVQVWRKELKRCFQESGFGEV